MDLISCLNIIAIVCPLFYCVFLLCFKVCLININKRLLNDGLIYLFLFSSAVFIFDYFIFKYTQIEANTALTFASFDKPAFNLDFLISSKNIPYLIYASLCSLVLSAGSKIYFKKYKHFIFTRQRYSSLLPFLTFILYLFIAGNNLFTMFIFWTLTSVGIYLFGFWDLAKNNINANISRSTKISFMGNFALLAFIALICKYNINNLNLDVNSVGEILTYLASINANIILGVLALLFIFVFAVRFYLFPFASYVSFLSNSSNLIYLTSVSFINSISGVYLFKSLIWDFKNISCFDNAIYLISLITILTSLFFILFEKNIKIIFGYIYSIINSLLAGFYIYFGNGIFIKLYFVINLILLLCLMALFYFDKTELSQRIINKNTGFFLYSIYIYCFEKLPNFLFSILNFTDKKIIQNITNIIVGLLEYIIFEASFGNFKFSNFSIIRNILLIFSLIVVIALLIALFGGVNAG